MTAHLPPCLTLDAMLAHLGQVDVTPAGCQRFTFRVDGTWVIVDFAGGRVYLPIGDVESTEDIDAMLAPSPDTDNAPEWTDHDEAMYAARRPEPELVGHDLVLSHQVVDPGWMMPREALTVIAHGTLAEMEAERVRIVAEVNDRESSDYYYTTPVYR
jgi:hypothetical protein